MKKATVLFSAIITILFFAMTIGCDKTVSSTNPSTKDTVNPANSNALQKVLKISGGTLKTGSIPASTIGTFAPKDTNHQPTAEVSPGNDLLLPFNYTSIAGIAKLYVQVEGATNGYFEITSLASSSNSGTVAIPITIPSNVSYGNFIVDYVMIDKQGNVSNVLNTIVTLSAPLTCTNATASGSSGLTFTTVQMGNTAGVATVTFETYTLPDRIDVYQGKTWLTGTGSNPGSTVPPQCNCNSPLPGFVGTSGMLNFNYNPANGKNITIVLSGCLGSNTAWDWHITCPQ
jgi:hypothetical protein